jgi:hypothetical protein
MQRASGEIDTDRPEFVQGSRRRPEMAPPPLSLDTFVLIQAAPPGDRTGAGLPLPGESSEPVETVIL